VEAGQCGLQCKEAMQLTVKGVVFITESRASITELNQEVILLSRVHAMMKWYGCVWLKSSVHSEPLA